MAMGLLAPSLSVQQNQCTVRVFAMQNAWALRPCLSLRPGIAVNWTARPITISEAKGPAAAAGILKGDSLTHIDGQEVPDPITLIKIANTHRVGDTVNIRIMRGSNSMDYNVRFINRDDLDSYNVASAQPPPSLNPVSNVTPKAVQVPAPNALPPATAAPSPRPSPKPSLSPISLINRVGSTVSCPPQGPDTWGLNNCVTNAESQGFVRVPDVSAGLGLDWNSKPVRVLNVSGPAAEAGVQSGDILLEFDGNKVTEAISVFKFAGKKKSGDYIIINVSRSGKPMTFTYQLTEK